MSDLIDRKEAVEAVKNEMLSWLGGDSHDYRDVVDAIMDVSTVDAVCDGCPVYYEMLNEIQHLRDKCRNYERTILKLSVALTERAERKEKVRPYDPIWDMYLDEFEDAEEKTNAVKP